MKPDFRIAVMKAGLKMKLTVEERGLLRRILRPKTLEDGLLAVRAEQWVTEKQDRYARIAALQKRMAQLRRRGPKK